MDTMVDFYCNVLGFHVTNRGVVGDDEEIVFISQDPDEHHQIVLVGGVENAPQFMFADHLAFRVDDLAATRAALVAKGVATTELGEHSGIESFAFPDNEGRWFAVIGA